MLLLHLGKAGLMVRGAKLWWSWHWVGPALLQGDRNMGLGGLGGWWEGSILLGAQWLILHLCRFSKVRRKVGLALGLWEWHACVQRSLRGWGGPVWQARV